MFVGVAVKHDELLIRLADYLGSMTDRMLWTDMQLGPSGSPRPDVYTMRKSYTQPKPMTYEVKVSTSDFRSDVTKGKWQSYLEFSCGVIFVVPKGLISKSDVPNGCGLMTYDEEAGRFTNLKKATLQQVSLPERVMLKLLIDGVKRQHNVNRRNLLNEYEIERRVRKTLGDEIASAVFDVRKAEQSRDYKLQMIQRQIEAEQNHLQTLRDQRQEIMRQRDQELSSSQREFMELIGLDPEKTFGTMAVRQRVRELAAALEKDQVVASLEDQLDRIRRSIAQPSPMDTLRSIGVASERH